MAILAPVIFSPMFLKNNNFLTSQLLGNLARHGATLYIWSTDLDGITFSTNKNLFQINGLSDIAIQLFHLDDIAF